MELTRLNKNDFDELFSLMTRSFPSAEYRKKEKQYALLDDSNYEVVVYKDEEIIKAFIAAWNLGSFVFAEHLAVLPEVRNGGIGSNFLKEYLSKLSLPLVLEVENIEDEISKRRINFYKRIGFELSDICYNQPNFDNTDVIIPLRIMYYDKNKKLDLSTVESTIFQKIYKRSENGENK
ncbi:MAG: GNAT family N-acetyltransferase [Clostridia bacterium]|nr:GNAT family N-acetyltransferase [Clostridia bacterium]